MTPQMSAVAVTAVSALLGASQAEAQEPAGCDKFKWDVTRERAALAQQTIVRLDPGADLPAPLPQSVTLTLQPSADAKLPSPPERAAKMDTFAGFSTVKNIPANGTYAIVLSAAAWVDVLQDGAFLKPKAFSGVTGCDGIRKVMKFDLKPGPAIIQLSGVPESTIKMAVMPVTK